MIELYKVINETEYGEDHTTQLTLEEARELMNNLEDMFPNEQYSIHIDEYVEPNEVRYYNNNAVDGWEDMFPSYE
tara:strand:+ start:9536 stop:9760 length:225 start_codon:yes stop_codon:yes gene_type:complete